MANPAPESSQTGRLFVGLKWKTFGLVLLLLALVHVILGVRSYLDLAADNREQVRARLASHPATFQKLIEDAGNELDNTAAVLASSARGDYLPGGAGLDDTNLAPRLLAELNSLEYFDAQGTRLGGWDDDRPDAPSDDAWEGEVLARVRKEHRPQYRLVCAGNCVQYAYIPTVSSDDRELIIELSVPIADVLIDFERITGGQLALMVPVRDGRSPVARLWNRDVVAVTSIAQLRPLLSKLANSDGPGLEAVSFGLGALEPYALMRTRLPGVADGRDAEILFVVDQTAGLQRMRSALRESITGAVLGLLLSGVALFFLLGRATHRLSRVTNALPMLAERRFAQTREALARIPTSPALRDEVDILQETAEWLARRLEALDLAEASSESKSRFLAAMSHEIRTPMNGILGIIDLMQQSRLDRPQRESLQIVQDSAHALLRVIDDILDFSKIEAGRIDIERVPLSPVDILEGVVETLAPALSKRAVLLLAFCEPAVPEQVLGDPVRLRQVLFNLVGNALKFTHAGRVCVRVGVAGAEPGTVRLRFEVTDTGIGIPEEAQAHLFKPFTQAESSTTRRFGGTGLGLSISHGLVERMGGSIAFESRAGRGSRFWFEVPLGEVPARAAAGGRVDLAGLAVDVALADGEESGFIAAYAAAAGARATVATGASLRSDTVLISDVPAAVDARGRPVPGVELACEGRSPVLLARPIRRARLIAALAEAAGRLHVESAAIAPASPRAEPAAPRARILVAEDHLVNQQVIARQLERLGYAHRIVGDGPAALEALQSEPFDLLLTDIHMPGLDGYELVAAVRAQERAASRGRLPVVALTANAMKGEAQRVLDAGMDGYLSKPVVLRELQECLARLARERPREIVDLAVVRDWIGDDEPAIDALFADFLRINEPLLAEIAHEIGAQHAQGAGALAHKLLGSARTVGATELANAVARVEAAARPGAGSGLAVGLRAVEAEFAALRAWIGARGAKSAA